MTSREQDAAEFRRALASSLTTTEAVALCAELGQPMTAASFRGSMTRERAKGPDFDYRTASRPVVLWSEARLRAWLDARPGRGNWR